MSLKITKTDTSKELAALEARKAELEKILAEPDVDPREWIGKYMLFPDESICILQGYDPGWKYHYRSALCAYETCRPVTLADLEGKIYQPKKATRYDWSRKDIPWWVRYWTTDENGHEDWWSKKPSEMRNNFERAGIDYEVETARFKDDSTPCPDWRDSLEERPEGV